MSKELLKKVYEDGQLFGRFVDFEFYYEEKFKDVEYEQAETILDSK